MTGLLDGYLMGRSPGGGGWASRSCSDSDLGPIALLDGFLTGGAAEVPSECLPILRTVR